MDAPLPISLIIPAYNEAAVIAQAVAEAENSLTNSFSSFEIIVVDDGSKDETSLIVHEEILRSPHTKLIQHKTNRGYGAALKTGFQAAKNPLVAFTDADCQFDLGELAQLARQAEEYDIVVGIRVDRKDPWRRRFCSKGYNFLARSLVGTRVKDVDCALKVFRRSILDYVMPETSGFFVNTEMMTKARLHGLSVSEMPVSHRPRLSGESKVSLLEIPKTFNKLINFWWKQIVWGPKALPTTSRVESWRATVESTTVVESFSQTKSIGTRSNQSVELV